MIEEVIEKLKSLSVSERIEAINKIKLALHDISPFASEPVDCVVWVKHENVHANDYNPNAVASPEMALLKHSIESDGYTQPIVTWPIESGYEVIDGFHRNRVGRENADIKARIHGYLPIVVANSSRLDKGDRMAATIRHNRARGKHKVESMSDIVLALKKRNWKDEKIAKELGMDEDEVLRLKQISGLAEMFKDQEFSRAWEVDFEEPDEVILDETPAIEPESIDDPAQQELF